MFKLIAYNDALDLDDFYKTASERGLYNNSSKQMLIDSISYENEWRLWILYYNDIVVGTSAAHSFPEAGPNSYRVAARTCAFTDMTPLKHIRTRNKAIYEHQNVVSQFYIPAGIDYFGLDKNYFITTNENEVGSQRSVNSIVCPGWAKVGALTKYPSLNYRDTKQTLWKININNLYYQLDKYGRWEVQREL